MLYVFDKKKNYVADSIYRKKLCIDGKQLNLEIFDPCSQVGIISYIL